MTIFHIQKSNEETQVKNPSTTQPTQDEKEELLQAQKTTGEASAVIDQEFPGQSTGSEKGSFSKLFEIEENPRPTIIKVDGPLGQIFTEALNKILAVESMAAIPMTEDDPRFQELSSKDPNILTVEAYDASELSSSDVHQLSEMVSKDETKDVLIAMEAIRTNKLSISSGLLSGVLQNKKNCQISHRISSAAAKAFDWIKEKQ